MACHTFISVVDTLRRVAMLFMSAQGKKFEHRRTLQQERSPWPREFFAATNVPRSRFEQVRDAKRQSAFPVPRGGLG
jgi:hypothetical protein